ncbi:MAG TPA: hemolysin family protein [Alphaproteobacteria bacterium]|nr:hemolysin family protein [Alphaproteobacteria bacterium]
MLVDLLIILLLFVANGFFAMAEMAIVAARRVRLEARAEAGSRGAETALRLAQNPGRFLSTVQTGVTLVGVLMGALSTTAVSAPLTIYLERAFALSPVVAGGVAFAIGIALTTFGTLIIGELVPKHIALSRSDAIAVRVARPLSLISKVALPIVVLLDATSRAVLWLLRIKRTKEDRVSEEEVRTLIAEGMEHGVFHPSEGEMVSRVLRFADRSVRSIMTPRAEVVWLDLDADRDETVRIATHGGHTRLPVARGSIEEVVGVVHIRDLLARAFEGGPILLAELSTPIPAIYESVTVLQGLEIMRKAGVRIALVVDEYGSIEGIVTLTDIFEAVVGDMPEAARDEAEIVERPDGSFLIDGLAAIEDVKLKLGLQALPGEENATTMGGFVLERLGRVPKTGDEIRYGGYVFEVVDMDGRRVDKLLITNDRPGRDADQGVA